MNYCSKFKLMSLEENLSHNWFRSKKYAVISSKQKNMS